LQPLGQKLCQPLLCTHCSMMWPLHGCVSYDVARLTRAGRSSATPRTAIRAAVGGRTGAGGPGDLGGPGSRLLVAPGLRGTPGQRWGGYDNWWTVDVMPTLKARSPLKAGVMQFPIEERWLDAALDLLTEAGADWPKGPAHLEMRWVVHVQHWGGMHGPSCWCGLGAC
jgi:hypothetical protein